MTEPEISLDQRAMLWSPQPVYQGRSPFSAFVLPDPVPTDHVLHAARPPVLTGHGDLDDVIGAGEPLRGLSFLRRHTTLTERSYAGVGHEISDQMLEDSMRFVDARLGR